MVHHSFCHLRKDTNQKILSCKAMVSRKKQFFCFVAIFCLTTLKVNGDQDLIDAINKFSIDFYKETKEVELSTFFLSPWSIHILLTLLSTGARGTSLSELNTALNIKDPALTQSAYKNALVEFNNMQSISLKIANKVYLKDDPDYLLSTKFDQMANDVFKSDAENIDFTDATTAASVINDWVQTTTDNIIIDFIKPSILKSNTVLLLVNAISFLGKWKDQFSVANTKESTFTKPNGDTEQVNMMSLTKMFNYAHVPSWNAKIVEMPYDNDEASFIIILPDKYDEFSTTEDSVLSSNINDVYNTMTLKSVEVKLPKFSIETKLDLNEILKKLGINAIFDDQTADLGDLLENNVGSGYVSDTMQSALIEVDEAGTKAGVSTAAVVIPKSQPEEFTADHGFMFILKAKNGQMLFVGRYLGSQQTVTTNNNNNNVEDWWKNWPYIGGSGYPFDFPPYDFPPKNRPPFNIPPFNWRNVYRPRRIRGVLAGYQHI